MNRKTLTNLLTLGLLGDFQFYRTRVQAYREASPARRKAFWLIFLLGLGTVAGAFVLSGFIPVRVSNPFEISQASQVMMIAGQNATQTFTVHNLLAVQIRVLVSATPSDPGIILWDSWPQTFTLAGDETVTVSVFFGVPDPVPPGDYRIDYSVTWLPI